MVHNEWHLWIKVFSVKKLPSYPHNLIQTAQSRNPQIWKDELQVSNTIVPLALIDNPNWRGRVQRQTPSTIEANNYWSNIKKKKKKKLNVLAIHKREHNSLLIQKSLRKETLLFGWKLARNFRDWLALFGLE